MMMMMMMMMMMIIIKTRAQNCKRWGYNSFYRM